MTVGRGAIVAEIIHAVSERDTGSAVLVGVDGRSASGKTTFANHLADALRRAQRPVIVGSMDGFHHPRARRYARGRFSPEGYLEDARDYQTCRRELLEPLLPGGDRRYRLQSWDLNTDCPAQTSRRTASARTVLVFEGTFIQRPEFDGCWHYVVLLQIPAAIATERGAERDGARLGGYAAAAELHRLRYQPAFDLYERNCRPAERANLVVDMTSEPTIVLRRSKHGGEA